MFWFFVCISTGGIRGVLGFYPFFNCRHYSGNKLEERQKQFYKHWSSGRPSLAMETWCLVWPSYFSSYNFAYLSSKVIFQILHRELWFLQVRSKNLRMVQLRSQKGWRWRLIVFVFTNMTVRRSTLASCLSRLITVSWPTKRCNAKPRCLLLVRWLSLEHRLSLTL